uniref:YitT family protein n=1 Tax=Romboutsia ilealis TaxID=1115758 RepID=UPI00272C0E9C
AVGLNMFLEPYTIASGGLTGLAIVFKSLFNTPLWFIKHPRHNIIMSNIYEIELFLIVSLPYNKILY